MARNRMIRVEFWEDDELATKCSRDARYLYLAMKNFADDKGYIPHKTKWLKNKCVPYDDDITEVILDKLISELIDSDYLDQANNIICIKNFLKDQIINRPRDSDLESIYNSNKEKKSIPILKKPNEIPVKINYEVVSAINSTACKWNNFAEKNALSQIIKTDGSRKKSILKRLKENDFDLDMIFKEILESDFLLGSKAGSNWKVNFDFIFCSPGNYIKILEGKYRNNGKDKSNWEAWVTNGTKESVSNSL